MATDIAFVVAALAILKSRIPKYLTVFLVSLAIVDDIGAVIIIAIFYTDSLNIHYFVPVTATFGALILTNILGFRRPLPYLALGVFLWFFVYQLGIHATVAGILVAMTIPARSCCNTQKFIASAVGALLRFRTQRDDYCTLHLNSENQKVVQSLRSVCFSVEPPLQRIEKSLHPWVFFGVMPLFALANSGVELMPNAIITAAMSRESIGIIASVWLFLQSGVTNLPSSLNLRHIYGGAVLCGIGFTMSLFIADLSFSASQAHENAKIAILFASTLSGLAGLIFLHLSGGPRRILRSLNNFLEGAATLVPSNKQGEFTMLNTRVLLVDDEDGFREAMAKRLTIRGLEVLTAEDGNEALRKLRQDPMVDVVVLDLKMPGMNGI